MGLDLSNQIAALRSEIGRMASGMRNPPLRSAFERGIEVAIDQVIQNSPPDKQKQTTGDLTFSHVTPGLRVHTNNGGIGTPAMPKLQAKHRILINKFMTNNRNLFGTFMFYTRSFRVIWQHCKDTAIEDDDVDHLNDFCTEEAETSFTAIPSPWLVKLGLRNQLHFVGTRSNGSWKHIFNTFRLVDDDAPIFRNIELGRVNLVKDIFEKGVHVV